MQSLDYSGALDYLKGLGARHKSIRESRIGADDPDPAGDARWPLLFVEEDAQAQELNPSADVYQFSFQVLTKDKTGRATTKEMLQLTKRIGDELVLKMRAENVVAVIDKANKLALRGTASDSLATGWRYEVQLQVVNAIDRTQVDAQFEPYQPQQ